MRLLILTQTVDTGDQALGFFHRWLEELSGKFETLEVVCLREGTHRLPANVHVHALGKPASKLKYILNFYRYIFSLQYDAVFVHMNEEYVLLGGWWWRMAGKKAVLWRNHKMGSWRTRLAARLSTAVCYTSPGAFVAHYTKAVQMPIGVDTGFFTPSPPAADSVLFLGRLDPVKKVEQFVEALALLKTPARTDIYGSPTPGNEAYAAEIKRKAAAVPGLALYPGVPHQKTRELYQNHAVYVNLTPSGSFDKTIGEAMASGCVVVCANEALRGVLPDALLCGDTAVSAAKSTDCALAMNGQERAGLRGRLRAYVEREHSLRSLIEKIKTLYDL